MAHRFNTFANGADLAEALATRVAAALAEATVSVDRARVLAAGVNERNRDAVAATQAELLNLAAQQGTFAGFCRDIEHVMRLADLDGAEPPQPRNHASVARTGDHVAVELHPAHEAADELVFSDVGQGGHEGMTKSE